MPGMKWIGPIVFSKVPETLPMDGRTDGQTSGWIQYTPILPSVERGYGNKSRLGCWAMRDTYGTKVQKKIISFLILHNRYFVSYTIYRGIIMSITNFTVNSVRMFDVHRLQEFCPCMQIRWLARKLGLNELPGYHNNYRAITLKW